MIVLTMLFLAPLFSDLPKAVLAALIIQAVVSGMMDVPEMQRLYRVVRADFWIAVAALVGVLTLGVLGGVIVGVFLSLGYIIYLSASPRMPELGRRPDSQAFRSIEEEPDAITYPGLLVLRIDSALYFANSDAPEDRLRELALAAEPPLQTIVIDFEGINLIDSQGADAIGKIVDLAGYNDIDVRLCRVKARIMEVLEKDGVIERLGAEHVYGNTYDAVADLIPPDNDTG